MVGFTIWGNPLGQQDLGQKISITHQRYFISNYWIENFEHKWKLDKLSLICIFKPQKQAEKLRNVKLDVKLSGLGWFLVTIFLKFQRMIWSLIKNCTWWRLPSGHISPFFSLGIDFRFSNMIIGTSFCPEAVIVSTMVNLSFSSPVVLDRISSPRFHRTWYQKKYQSTVMFYPY